MRLRPFHLLVCISVCVPLAFGASPFIARPYLQLGDHPRLQDRESLVLLWHAADRDANWSVELRPSGGKWRPAGKPSFRRIAVPSIEPHRVYQAALDDLEPGAMFEYQVLYDGKPAFSASAKARQATHQFYRFAVFGDIAQGTPGQRATAFRAFSEKPDFVFVPGDIVYSRGRISEYRSKFFPVYTAEQPDPQTGAPLIGSTLFIAAPGNHDTATGDLNANPDGLAYFYYWSQPLNGPELQTGSPQTTDLKAEPALKEAFLHGAGGTFPKMANFSFDYGNSHWTVIDSNRYADWNQPVLRDWLIEDLKKAKNARWRFVAFHHPGFNSSKTHLNDQWMRLLAPIFEQYKVDIVFSGHVHNYQRSYPLTFAPAATAAAANGAVDGKWTLDRDFDGAANSKPKGVIYIVTGAGGASLYNPEQQQAAQTWQEFTVKYFADRNSITVVDVKDNVLNFRQVGADGVELDRFQVSK